MPAGPRSFFASCSSIRLRVQLERRAEPLGRLLRPAAVEVAETELEQAVLVVRVELDRPLEGVDGVPQAAPLVGDRPEERERLRVLLDLDGPLQERLGLRQLPRPGVDRSEREGREEGVRPQGESPLEVVDRVVGPPEVVLQDARVDEGLEVLGPPLEDVLQRRRGLARLSVVEPALPEEERQLRVPAVQLPRLLEDRHRLLGIEGEEGELGLPEEADEPFAPRPLVLGENPLLALEEAFALLEDRHVLVDTPFPELDELLFDEEPLPLEKVLEGEKSRLDDEAVLLLPMESLEEDLQRLGAPLDDLLEDGDPLEEVLVEGDPLSGGPLVVRLARAGDDEELVLALPAELLVEVVRRAADLADQAGTFSPPGPE